MPTGVTKGRVTACNRTLYRALNWGARIACALMGIRVSFSRRCEALPEGPAIVLGNHGSLLDFAYTGTLLHKCFPHFVVARYYFYHKGLSRLLKLLGAFPKSQLETDVESAKNCLRVLRSGEVLFLMPEARICTAGRFEDIQHGTFSFLKKAGVPVYTVRLCGGYFSYPKWARAPRRGAVVESELDLLFTARQLEQLSVDGIRRAVEDRLRYDEFQWLETRPQVRYRSRRLAEGLENILTRCPVCGARYTITTRGRELFCGRCGRLAALDDRYAFSDGFRFRHFAAWYDWQKRCLEAEILADPDYALRSAVTLQLPSRDGRTFTRDAGEGVCTLNRAGLSYAGTRDGQPYEIFFPLKRIYRLIYGAGEGFQIHNGSELMYFLPEERRSAVDWYLASMILYDEEYGAGAEAPEETGRRRKPGETA